MRSRSQRRCSRGVLCERGASVCSDTEGQGAASEVWQAWRRQAWRRHRRGAGRRGGVHQAARGGGWGDRVARAAPLPPLA